MSLQPIEFKPPQGQEYLPVETADGGVALVYTPEQSAVDIAEPEDLLPPVITLAAEPVQTRQERRQETATAAPNRTSGRRTGGALLALLAAGGVYTATQNVTESDFQAPSVTKSVPKVPIYRIDTSAQEANSATADKTYNKKAERQAWLDKMYELPYPVEYEDGAFVGAMSIHYKDTAANLAVDGPIAAYYQNTLKTSRPPINNPLVHRLVVDGGDDTQHLAEGGVLEKASTPDNLILAFHDVTPVDAPLELNGTQYAQQEMGKNAVPVLGDTLDITLNRDNGYTTTFTYELIGTKAVAATLESRLAMASFAHDKPIVQTYMCWLPGSTDQRLVGVWEKISARIDNGTVRPVGTAKILGANH